MNEELLSSLRERGFTEIKPGVWAKPKRGADDSRPTAVMEPNPGHEPLAKAPLQKSVPARFHVRITSVRKRLIDPDNIAVKYVLDNCRAAGFIPDDSAKHIELTVGQRLADRPEPEHTEIIIQPLI